MGNADHVPHFPSFLMFLLTLICPFSVVAWSIVENKNRSSSIPGVLLPRFFVQLNDNEILSEANRTLAFLEWSRRSIDTAVAEGRGTALETRKDSVCYPGPKPPNARNIFYCDQLSRADETVSEAQDFFLQLSNSTQSLANAPTPIADQFNWHLKKVEILIEKLPMAGGQFGTDLERTYSLATGMLDNLTSLEIVTLNTKIAESQGSHVSHDPPKGMFNGAWSSPPNIFTKLPPIPSRPPPSLNGTSMVRPPPRPRRPCRSNSSDVDRLFNETDVRDDIIVQLLLAMNSTDKEEELCDDVPNMKKERQYKICNRSFWQQDFTQKPIFKKVQFLLGNQISVIEKVVSYARNLSTSDANFTIECKKFLNSTNLRQVMGMFTTGNLNRTSIVDSLTDSGLLSNISSISFLLSGILPAGNSGGQLSGILNGLSTNKITSLLSGTNESVSPSLTSIVSQLPSNMNSVKSALLNSLGPNVSQIGQFLKGIVV